MDAFDAQLRVTGVDVVGCVESRAGPWDTGRRGSRGKTQDARGISPLIISKVQHVILDVESADVRVCSC